MDLLNKMFIEDIEVKGKKVIMRVDFNVPLNANLEITSDKRIVAALPSIKYLIENGAALILMSHLGRPKGEKKPEMSLKPVAARLSELLGKEVKMAPDCIGAEVEAMAKDLAEGEVLLLENLRYYKEETANDAGFAEKLASLADVFVNDAFGTAHRAHASTEGVTKFFEVSAMGYLLKKEVEFLVGAIENAEKPFVAIIGGSKISGKIDVIKQLLPKVDKLIIGGGMAYTFFKAKGLEIGNSLLEEDKIDLAKELMAEAGDKLVLPIDNLVTDALDFGAMTVGNTKVAASDAMEAGWIGVDLGPEATKLAKDITTSAKTVLWNGPMGISEIKECADGTFTVAQALADATKNGAVTVIGGGDSVSAIERAGLANEVSHVSTGGGASLELLEGKILPGLTALTDK